MGLKVANVIEDGRLAGPQIRMAMVAEKLRQHGIDTTVVCPDYDNVSFQQLLESKGLPAVYLPIHRLTRQKKHLLLYFLFFGYELWLLARLFRNAGFDIVHVSGGAWQYKGVIAGKLAGCKVVWHLNDTRMPALIRGLCRMLAKWMTDGLVVAGRKVRQYYVEELGITHTPVYEIQAPVDTAVFDPVRVDKTGGRLRTQGINITTIGNVNPNKGLASFIRMAGLLNSIEGLNFYIIGPVLASQMAYYNSLIRLKEQLEVHNLIFYGACDDIPAGLSQTDIYVCASETEASPMAVWEAMSMARAVVSTDVGDVSRFVQDGENGFTVPVNVPELMAEKVRTLVESPSLRQAFGRRARQTAVEKLDISVVAEQHKRMYEEMVNQGR